MKIVTDIKAIAVDKVEGIYATRYVVRVSANSFETYNDPGDAFDRAVELARLAA